MDAFEIYSYYYLSSIFTVRAACGDPPPPSDNQGAECREHPNHPSPPDSQPIPTPEGHASGSDDAIQRYAVMPDRLPQGLAPSMFRTQPLGLALLAPACPLAAQALGDIGLPAIEVTAAKSQGTAFEIPESVTVLDQSMIKREQATNLGDLLETLPNVTLGGGPRGQGQTLSIRGLPDEQILFLVDGARQNFLLGHSTRVFIEPDLLKAVEVLRGPASAYWGSGALGGVVALATLDAADLLRQGQQRGGRVKVGYQDASEQWLTSAGIYGITADGRLDYLLDLSYRDASDIRLGDGSDLSHSGFERLSGLAKGTWSPDGINSIGLSYMAFDQDGSIPSNPQSEASDTTLVDNSTRQENFILSYRHENPDTPFLQPSLLLYRNSTAIEERRLFDGRRDETRLETLGLDLRNTLRPNNPPGVRHFLTYGVDFHQDRVEGERNGQPRNSYPDGETQVLGLYLQDDIRIGERWTLTPGLRWSRFRSEADAEGLTTSEDSALSAKLGLDVALTPWLSLQASYHEAFRAPSASELFVSGTHFTCGPGCANLFVPNPDLKPEKARNKELGLRLHRADLCSSTAMKAVCKRASFTTMSPILSTRSSPSPCGPWRATAAWAASADFAMCVMRAWRVSSWRSIIRQHAGGQALPMPKHAARMNARASRLRASSPTPGFSRPVFASHRSSCVLAGAGALSLPRMICRQMARPPSAMRCMIFG